MLFTETRISRWNTLGIQRGKIARMQWLQSQDSAMKEARFLAQLASHDMKNINIVRYEESFIHQGHLCIVMELCDGDLDTEIKKRKRCCTLYSEDEIMETFVQVLMGLAHMHNNRILHRGVALKDLVSYLDFRAGGYVHHVGNGCTCFSDVKSQNIFLGKGGIVKLGDMGIAKVLETTLEQCKSVVGTPYYMCGLPSLQYGELFMT